MPHEKLRKKTLWQHKVSKDYLVVKDTGTGYALKTTPDIHEATGRDDLKGLHWLDPEDYQPVRVKELNTITILDE